MSAGAARIASTIEFTRAGAPMSSIWPEGPPTGPERLHVRGGIWDRTRAGLVEPGRLAEGLRAGGAGASTPARSSSGPRTAGAWPVAPATRGSGWARRGFRARVVLDLLDGRRTEATALRYVRRRPVPFPPEPLRWAVIELTRNRLAAADRREGRRGMWLRLDRLGLDS